MPLRVPAAHSGTDLNQWEKNVRGQVSFLHEGLNILRIIMML